MLVNPGFESALSGWNNWGNAAAVTGQAASGSYALRVGTGSGGLGQNVLTRLTPGARYRLTGSARLSVAGDFAWVGVKFENASGGVLQESQVRIMATSYSPFSVEFTAPTGAAVGYVYVWKSAGAGYVYVDALDLR